MGCWGGRGIPVLGPILALRGAGLGAPPPGADIFTGAFSLSLRDRSGR